MQRLNYGYPSRPAAALFFNGRCLLDFIEPQGGALAGDCCGHRAASCFGLAIFKVGFIARWFEWLSSKFVAFLDFERQGAMFLFGGYRWIVTTILQPPITTSDFCLPFKESVAYRDILLSCYRRIILPRYPAKNCLWFAWVMARTMRLSGAESLSAAANIFMGQTEAPLLVNPSSRTWPRASCSVWWRVVRATIAGSVLAVYVWYAGRCRPGRSDKFATYLLCASIMNAPAAIVMSKLFFLRMNQKKIDSTLKGSTKEQIGSNLVDALASGAGDGIKLALNIGGMLLAFIAIILALNWGLNGIGDMLNVNAWIKESTAVRTMV